MLLSRSLEVNSILILKYHFALLNLVPYPYVYSTAKSTIGFIFFLKKDGVGSCRSYTRVFGGLSTRVRDELHIVAATNCSSLPTCKGRRLCGGSYGFSGERRISILSYIVAQGPVYEVEYLQLRMRIQLTEPPASTAPGRRINPAG